MRFNPRFVRRAVSLIRNALRSCGLDRFLDKINETKLSDLDQLDHNKLRTYRTYKSSFTREPYIDLIRNRNQRCFLTRLRTGSHNLRVELGRHTKPITPFAQRTCLYCNLRPHVPGRAPQGPAAGSNFHFHSRLSTSRYRISLSDGM